MKAANDPLANAILDLLASSHVMERSQFWRAYAGGGLEGLRSESTEALQMLTGTDIVSSKLADSAQFLARNPTLKARATALAGAIEQEQGGTTDRLASISGVSDVLNWDPIGPSLGLMWCRRRVFDRAVSQFETQPEVVASSPGLTLSYAYALFQCGRGAEAERLCRAAIAGAAEASAITDGVFWEFFASLGEGDTEFSALVASLVSEHLGQHTALMANITVGLIMRAITLMAPTDNAIRACRKAIQNILFEPATLAKLSPISLAKVTEAGVAIEEAYYKVHAMELGLVTPEMAQALRLAGRLAFALGHEDQGYAWFKRSAAGPESAQKSMKSLRLARACDIPSIPSVASFATGTAFPIPPTPMARVDNAPLRRCLDQSIEWVAELRDPKVHFGDRAGSGFFYVETRDGWLLADGLNVHPRFHFGSDLERFPARSPGGRVLMASRKSQEVTHNGSCVLLGGYANYYHWMLEYLPKLANLKLMLSDTDMSEASFLVNADFTPWQMESLLACGASMSRLVRMNGGTCMQVSRLVVPSTPSTGTAIRFLRQALGMDQTQGTSGKRIYVSRLDADPSRRRIADEDELALRLSDAGYDVLVPAEMSFSAQATAFSDAEVIIGPHGAGLANLVFAPANAVVVEITNRTNQAYRFFSDITDVLNCRYVRHRATREVGAAEPENASAIVDCEALLSTVDAVVSGSVEL